MTTPRQQPQQEQRKRLLLGWAALRLTTSIVALALVPFLFRHHFVVLAALRPSQGILLAGGYLAHQGRVSLVTTLAAAVPLLVLAIWLYYTLGRAWSAEIDSDDELPFLASRLLQRDRVRDVREALRDRGPALVFLARFALFPAGFVAAAAGSAGLDARHFFLTDAAATILATGLAVGAGYGLGVAHDRAGPWLVAVGVAGLAAMSAVLTRQLRRRR